MKIIKLNESTEGYKYDLQLGPNDVIVDKKTGKKFKILKPQDGKVRVLNMDNKIVSHISNDYLTSKNFYVESLNESTNETNSKTILYIEVMSGVNADGFTAIVTDSTSGEEVFRQTYYYGYDASYDHRWASSRAPYVTDIINDLKNKYNVIEVEVTAGKNIFKGDSMSMDSVEKFKKNYLSENITKAMHESVESTINDYKRSLDIDVDTTLSCNRSIQVGNSRAPVDTIYIQFQSGFDKYPTLVGYAHLDNGGYDHEYLSANDIGNYDLSRYMNGINITDLEGMLRDNPSILFESVDKFKKDYLNESVNLSEEQLDKAMELVDTIYKACNSIYNDNKYGNFAKNLPLNESAIYYAALDLHDLVEPQNMTESITESVVNLSKAKDAETTSFSMASGDYVSLGEADFDNKELAKQLKSQGYVMLRDTVFASGRDITYVKEPVNESKSITESAEEDKPYSYKEVEKELKSITNNWKDKDGTVRCYYQEEKDCAVKILRRHYKIVEVSQDGDWRVIAFATPIQKESMLEDYLREADYAEKASRLSLRDINSMLDLLDDGEDTDNKFSEYVNALKAEKAKKEKEAEYKNSRKFKRDELGLEGKYPYYVTLYHEYPIYEPAEGGYYYAGLQAHSAEGYNSFKEAAQAINQTAKELVDSGYNFVKKSAGEYQDYGDKYIGTGSILCIENNKQFRSRERGYQPYQ